MKHGFAYMLNCHLELSFLLVGTVWIVGDSIVRRARTQFHLPVNVLWNGKGGAGVCDISNLLTQLDAKGPPPTMLILHAGTNDLVAVDEFALRRRVSVLLSDCATRYPNAIVVWSDILPRVFYIGARSQPALERKRRTINRWVKSQSCHSKVFCLHHPQFVWSDVGLFRYDGVHLSPYGNHLFVDNIRRFMASHIKS